MALLENDKRRVVECLALLSRRQREVLVLRYWTGLREQEIADALGIAAGTVKSTASRALKILAEKLEEPG
jgi:RNA polymerase sigma factor (sigma-70 family)